MKVIKKNFFTLLEVMVSMGVFCILMLALMQFFSASQDVWSKSGKRAELYSFAHLAMGFLVDDLTCLYPSIDPDSKVRCLYLPDEHTMSLVSQKENTLFEIGYRWCQTYTENGKTYYTGRLYRKELSKEPEKTDINKTGPDGNSVLIKKGDYELPWFSRPDADGWNYKWMRGIEKEGGIQEKVIDESLALLDDVIYFSIRAFRKNSSTLQRITTIEPASDREETIPDAFLITMVIISQETRDKLASRGYSPHVANNEQGIAKLFTDNQQYILGTEDPYKITDEAKKKIWENEQSPERILADECQVFSRIILTTNGKN